MLRLTHSKKIKTGVTLRSNPNLEFKIDPSMNREIVVKPYSIQELCDLYGVSNKTLRKWLRPFLTQIGERKGWFYTVIQVETIFMKIGLPYNIREED